MGPNPTEPAYRLQSACAGSVSKHQCKRNGTGNAGSGFVSGPFPSKQGSDGNQGSGLDFQGFLQLATQFGRTVSKHQLEQATTIFTKARYTRFKFKREPKYGSINNDFTEVELQQFLRNVHTAKFHLLFRYQACLGLRVGEVCKLHVSNIDFDKRERTIQSEKSHRMDSLIIPLDLFKETVEFINCHTEEIKVAQGYIFYKGNDHNHSKAPHLAIGYVRKVFREILRASNLAQVYATSEETGPTHKERPLYGLTTHSLRHYAITHFAKSTNGNVVLASRFARHVNPATTMRYIAKDNEGLYRNIDFAFDKRSLDVIRQLAAKRPRFESRKTASFINIILLQQLH